MAKKTRVLTAVGCNIFAGLFTRGVRDAGFRANVHLEHCKYGMKTAQLNLPQLEVRVGLDAWRAEELRGTDFVYCNPPCAVWSRLGNNMIKGTDWRADPRLQRAYDALSLIETVQPRVWAWESVPGALSVGRALLMEMAERGATSGYAMTVLAINAKYLGVPQERPRIFVVLHRVDFEPEPCDYDHVLTVADVWKRLPALSAEERRMLQPTEALRRVLMDSRAGPGAHLYKVFDAMYGDEVERNAQGKVRGRPPFKQRRVDLKNPAKPVLAGLMHPTQPRYISSVESLRICQLPDDWKFELDKAEARRELLQRSVMPKVGEWLARGVAKALRADQPVDETRVRGGPLVYDLRRREREIYALGLAASSSARSGRDGESAPKPARAPRPAREPRPPRERVAASPDAVEKAKRVCQNMTTGSGAHIRRLLLQGAMSDDQIVADVLKAFPQNKTTRSDVSWNRGMLRKAGLIN